MTTRIIANPKAGAGKALERAQTLQRILKARGLDSQLALTERPGHGCDLAHQAFHDGVQSIAAIGGDGTFSEVSQAYLCAAGTPREGPRLALLPCGTGSDFFRSTAPSVNLEKLVENVATGRDQRVDLGLVELRDREGRPTLRAFLNIVSIGLSAAVNRRVATLRWLGGRLGFLGATAREVLSYSEPPIIVETDGVLWQRGPVLICALANGRYFGGGMQIAPQARLDDGALDAVFFGGAGLPALASLLPRLYSGDHIHDERVSTIRHQVVTVRPAVEGAEIWVDVDGECPGMLPLRAWVAPRALRLIPHD
jgi:diacylglycerol kinase (ATP)